jgi:hypothetical protein
MLPLAGRCSPHRADVYTGSVMVKLFLVYCTFVPKRMFMRTTEIIKEIQNLPIRKRIYVLEKTSHSLGKQEDAIEMKKAAEALYVDYTSDKELTGFTALDFENFYETR